MVTTTCKTAYWEGTGHLHYSTLTSEPKFLYYSWRHRFFQPALVVVTLDDAGGAATQKYKVDPGASPTTTYLGSGRLTIEEDGSKILDLRILDALPDIKNGLLQLLCEDYMSQLKEPLCQYDTREDLNGSGLRESTVTAIQGGSLPHVYTDSGKYYMADNAMSWAADHWNGGAGTFKVLFSGKMAGSHTITVHAYDETVNPATSPMTTDDPAQGEDNVYYDAPYTCHTLEDAGDASDQTFDVTYAFRPIGTKFYSGAENLITSVTAMRWKVIWSLEVTAIPAAKDISVAMGPTDYTVGHSWGDAGLFEQTWKGVAATGYLQKRTTTYIQAPYQHEECAIYHAAGGTGQAAFIIVVNTGASACATVKLRVYQVLCEVTLNSNAPTKHYLINDTYTQVLEVESSLDYDGGDIWEGAPYSICQKISNHINPLVTAYDPLMTLATSVDATDVYLARHNSEQSPLGMLTEWARDVGAVVWCYLDGSGNPTVRWKTSWTPPGAGYATLTDSNVLQWDPRQEWDPVSNEYHILPMRGSPDSDTYVNSGLFTTDPGSDSKALFGLTKARFLSNQNIYTKKDATDLAGVLVERDEDMQLVLVAYIAGRLVYSGGSTFDVRLGDYVQVTSALLNLSAVGYWVVDFNYDMLADITKLTLHPDVTSDKFVEVIQLPEIFRGIDRTRQLSQEAARQTYTAPLWKETW
jgi:hypothetical protein